MKIVQDLEKKESLSTKKRKLSAMERTALEGSNFVAKLSSERAKRKKTE